MMRYLPWMTAVMALAACSGSSPDKTSQPSAAPSSEAAVPAPAPSPTPVLTPSAKPIAIIDSTKLYEFSYTYPAQAAAIPALAGWFKLDAAKHKRELIAQAKEGQAEARADKRTYYPYGHSTKWQVVTDIPGWLSLSADRWDSLGGAHPNPWQESLIWEKQGQMRHRGTDFFLTEKALTAALQQPFCAELDKQRAAKRGGPVNRKSGDEFDKCIDPAKQTIILGSTDKQHFTRIGVLVGPYEAGPYAEGNYEVTLPVTPAIIKAIKPMYRKAFAVPN